MSGHVPAPHAHRVEQRARGVAALGQLDTENLAWVLKRRRNRRLWRWLARAPEAVAGRPVVRLSHWECCAAQSRQARAEEAQGPSWGSAKGGL